MKTALILVFLAFSVLSGWAMWEVGYFGIWTGALDNPGSIQVLADLIVVGCLACVWMLKDAKLQGRNPWPFVVITLTAGSFGPLLYLISGKSAASD